MARRKSRKRDTGPFIRNGEVMNESEIASAANTHVSTATLLADIPGADDIRRLALERARRLLRLGGIEASDATSKDGSILPLAKGGAGGA